VNRPVFNRERAFPLPEICQCRIGTFLTACPAMNPKKITTALVLFLCAMLLLHVFLLWQVRGVIAKGYPDFTTFYMAGKMIRTGLGHELYDLAAEWRVQQEFAPWVSIRQAALPYMHAPFEGLLFVPLSLLPYHWAFFVWDAFNLLILGFLPYLLRPHLPVLGDLSPILVLIVELAYFPVFFVLLQGQDVILLLLFYSLAYIALKNGSQERAGLWLALGLFRFHLILPFVLVLVLVKKYRMVASFALTGLILAGISVWVVGWRTLLHYPGYIWWLEQHKSSQILTPSDTTNLRGLMDTFFGKRLPAPVLLTGVILLSVLTLLAAFQLWRKAERRRAGIDIAFSATLLAAVLVGYHSFIYDLSALLIPVAITLGLLQNKQLPNHVRLAFVISLLAIFCTPLYLFLWFRAGHPNLMAIFLLVWLVALVRAMDNLPPQPDEVLREC
jgi:hypothetical protein